MANGKAQLQKTNVDVMSLLQKNKREIYGYLRQQGSASPQSEITPNNGGNQYTPVVTNFLKQSGGSMYGPFAWGNVAAQNNQALADNLIIKKGDGKGHLDVSTSGVYGSYASVFLDPVSWFPASVVGSLSFIDNATWDGQTLKISLPWLSNSGAQFTLEPDGNILFEPTINNVFNQQYALILTFVFDSSVHINSNSGGTWILDYISPNTNTTGANTTLSNLTAQTAINQDLIFGNGLSTTAKNIDNVNTIYFKDSTTGGSPPHTSTRSYILPSGDSKQLSFFLSGFDAMELSTDGSTTGVLQIFGKNGVGTIKPTSLKVNPVNTLVGETRYDGFNSSASEITYAGTSGLCVGTNPGNESGRLKFNTVISGVYTEVGHVDSLGWDFNNNIIYEERHPITIVNGANYTALTTDSVMVFTDATFDRNITLPQASTVIGKRYTVFNDSPVPRTVNILAHAGDFINTGTGVALTARYWCAELISVGSGFWLLVNVYQF